MAHVKSNLPCSLDLLQFAYRPNMSTEDAISTALHLSLSQLEKKDAYVRMLFIDFSSAFNTIIPQKLFDKLSKLMLSGVAGRLRRAQLDCETVATPRLRDVSHELHIEDTEDIKDDVEIICPPSQMPNFSDCPKTLPQLFNCGTAFSEEVTEERRLSLRLFIKQLVAHIEKKSDATTSNVDLSKLEAHVRLRIPFNLRFSHPKAFDKVLIPIYKDLCQQFGSKYLVLAAMNSGDVAFEAAVAERLKTRLTASAQEPDNLVKRHFFKRSFKVALLRDVKPRHTEENSQSNKAAVSSLMNRKGDGFGKRLSFMASVMKTLTILPQRMSKTGFI